MSHQAVAWAMEVRVGDPTLKSLLVAIAHRADRTTWACWPSLDALAYDTEVSKRTIQRRLDDLVELGFIRIEKRRRSDGTQDSSMITITGGQIVTLSPPVDRNGLTGGQKQGVPVDTAVHLNKQEEQEEQSIGGELPLGATAPPDLEKQFFDRAVQVITSSPKDARSTAASLRKACGMDIAKARSVLELSATKSDPAHWIRGHIAWLKKKAAEPSDTTVLMTGADDRHVLM